MKRLPALCATFLLLTAVIIVRGSAYTPPRDILGVRLDMSKQEAHALLQKIGRLEAEERKRQEIWIVADRTFSHLIIGFDGNDKVRFVTAVARPDGQRVRYAEVANLKDAKQAGDLRINNIHYVWERAAQGSEARAQISARGRDPVFLQYLSLKKLD